MIRFFSAAVTAAVIAVAGFGAASAENILGPKIDKPACEEGKCPKFTKGFGAQASKITPGKPPESTEMGRARVTVSDRCFVTTRDYCYMDGYAAIGEACYCTDGYYVYPGVVY